MHVLDHALIQEKVFVHVASIFHRGLCRALLISNPENVKMPELYLKFVSY